MRQTQTMSILGGMPQSSAYVLDVSLINAIYDAKAVTPTVLNSYVDKLEESKTDNSSFVDEAPKATDRPEYLTPQEEITQRLAAQEAEAEVEALEVETEEADLVVIEKAEEGTNPFT